ncbi:GIY-YIG nuclease family protein [Pseudoalteromonas luteoviolacea]|uniref:GIY-YIG nuclease family protein n=1 Tax=Pseudoalteromonas luteoviolacea TaxID=43657 RepID=UPI00114FC370|nr:GIY-YIG nuclease family protein [Pseudoalteromonas luteoviolacea]TQF71620.1 GIY-YIG nuclease family protein [Pseudoalteromonas luteoviolacea]
MNKNKPDDTNWLLYVIENAQGHWYTGITNDLERRITQHRNGKGAKSLRGKGPLKLIIALSGLTKVDAAKLEWQVKKLNKKQKIQLVSEALESAYERTNPVIEFETCVSFSRLISVKASSVV